MRQADAKATVAEQVPEIGTEVVVVVDHQDQGLVEDFLHEPQELAEVDRLGDHLPGPGREGRLGRLRTGVRRHEQRNRAGALLLDLSVERHAVHAGHLQIEESDIIGMLAHQLQRREPVEGEVDLIAQVGEDVAEVAADVLVVVDNEDSVYLRARHDEVPSPGAAVNRRVKTLPRPISLITRNAP